MHQTECKIEKNKKEQERIESQNHKLYLLLPNVKILHRNGNIYELQMHQYQFLPIDVHKDSKNEGFIYISIPFDSQRITSRLFLTKNRYCSRVTHHKTQTRPRRNKTLIPRRTTSCLHHAPSKQITFYSARISAEYSISNPSRTTPATLFT